MGTQIPLDDEAIFWLVRRIEKNIGRLYCGMQQAAQLSLTNPRVALHHD